MNKPNKWMTDEIERIKKEWERDGEVATKRIDRILSWRPLCVRWSAADPHIVSRLYCTTSFDIAACIPFAFLTAPSSFYAHIRRFVFPVAVSLRHLSRCEGVWRTSSILTTEIIHSTPLSHDNRKSRRRFILTPPPFGWLVGLRGGVAQDARFSSSQ